MPPTPTPTPPPAPSTPPPGRLETDLAEAAGRPQYRRASLQLDFAGAARTRFGGWTGGSGSGVSVTSVAVCAPHHAYTTATDGSLTKWRLQDLPRDQWPQTTRNKPKKPPAPPKRKPERVAWRKAENGDKKKGEKGEKGVRKGRKKGAPTPLTQPGHTGGGLLAVAASPDGRFVATGGADRRLVIWDAATLRPLKTFALHRGAVTGLAFRRGGSNQLFSASRDRSIKVWSAAELAYVETLYGHQDDVVDVAALGLERCVSVGARDRTARYWKVAEESQLVFRGGGGGSERRAPALPSTADPRSLAHEGSMDCVAMVDDELFVTGSDNGSLALWSIHKKKALFVLPRAHGLDPPLAPADVSSDAEADPTLVPPPQPRWITALAALPYTDTVLSGSWDGCVRVWRVGAGRRTLEPVGVLGSSKQTTGDGDGEDEAGKTPVATNGERGMVNPESRQPPILGIINDIAMFERGERPGQDGLCVVVGSGREIRLGRWKVMKGAKGGAFVFEVPRLAAQEPVTSGVGGAHEEAGGTRA
ncbi:hypothetical protein P8C59_001603 [Phyllachora maydis]|uniref:WD40 repeat-like protein n=1 Tax=Phyllachora maydis TaxID=1825666 RepID=A0AAD9M843_9PEZI|nr:hypothetical protein P8C59_001603 [Phyllachora maydis]